MKKSNAYLTSKKLVIALAALAMSMGARAAEPTAFQLVKQGDQYVGDQSKDRVVQIRSEKSAGSLRPSVWYVVYYDPTATLKATEVKFGAGQMMAVQRPLRLLEPISGGDLPLDRDKLKVDSNDALQMALHEPLAANLKVTATQLKLERVGEGVLGRGAGEPVWKIKLWASSGREPGREVDIGEVWVSAADGKVIKDDLHPNSIG
jgi:hypothetical protein